MKEYRDVMRSRDVPIPIEMLAALLGAGRELARQADLAAGDGLAGLSPSVRAELATAIDAAERALRMADARAGVAAGAAVSASEERRAAVAGPSAASWDVC